MASARILTLISLIAFSPMLIGQEQRSNDAFDDAEITARVKVALIDDENARARNIDVETSKGIVQLSGFVESEDAKRAAETAARGVEGVASVRNELIVRQGERTAGGVVDDSVIAAKVKAQLADDVTLRAANKVNVEVRAGVVQLSGYVDTAEKKRRAASIASGVDGVRDVRNNIATSR